MAPSFLPYVLILVIVAIMIVHAIRVRNRRRWFLLDPLNLFWAGALVVNVLQPIEYANTFVDWHSVEIFQKGLLWTAIGFLFVVLGYESRLGVRLGLKHFRISTQLRPERVWIIGWIFVGIGVYAYATFMASAGGPKEWLSIGRGGTIQDAFSGYFRELEHALPFGVTLLLFSLNFRRSSYVRIALIWGLAFLALWWLMYLGSRSRTIIWVLTMLAAYYLPRRRNPKLWLAITVFAALMIIVNFQSYYRMGFTNLSFNLDAIDMQEATERVMPYSNRGMDVATGIEFNLVLSVLEVVPNLVDYNYGYSLLHFLVNWIPRFIWHEKRYPHYEAFTPIYIYSGVDAAPIQTYPRFLCAGPTFTFVAYWYAVGGPVALMLAGWLTGCFFRFIRTIYDRDPFSQGGLILYVTLISIGFYESAAAPLFWLVNLPFVVLAIFGIAWFAGKRSHGLTQQVARRNYP